MIDSYLDLKIGDVVEIVNSLDGVNGKIGIVVEVSASGLTVGVDFRQIINIGMFYTWRLDRDLLPTPTGRYFSCENIKLYDDKSKYSVDLL